MRRIYKWPLAIGSNPVLPWSVGDKALMVAEQNGHLTLWAEQDDTADEEFGRRFTIVGTGFEAPAGLEHVGSAVCGAFVWHVYAEVVST